MYVAALTTPQHGVGASGEGHRQIFCGAQLTQGDFFDVLIRRDPVYGTPVFEVVSGRSSTFPSLLHRVLMR